MSTMSSVKSPISTTSLRGAVAFVTGGSSGIGRAIVRDLAGLGMRVAFCARRTGRLAELGRELGPEHLPLAVDVTSKTELQGAFDRIRRDLGPVNVLVNNAGLGRHAPLSEDHCDAWREMLEVNVLALSVATQLAVTQMNAADRSGHIVNISSMSGHRVPGGSGMYAASKHAVRALTEALRMELRAGRSGIRVSSVSPGFVETEFAELYYQSPEQARAVYDRYRVLGAEDVAAAVRYLLLAPPHVQVHDILLRPTDQES